MTDFGNSFKNDVVLPTGKGKCDLPWHRRAWAVFPVFAMLGVAMCVGGQTLDYQIDFESGDLSQGNTDACGGGTYAGCDCDVGTSMIVTGLSPGPVRSGDYSCKIRVIDCHERAEMKIAGALSGNTEWWVGWSLYMPDDYDVSKGGIVAQFHDVLGSGGLNNNPCSDYPRGGPSLFQFSSTTGQLGFAMRYQRDNCGGCLARRSFNDLQHIDAMRGTWTDFVVNANFSCDNDAGFFKLWIRQTNEAWPVSPSIDYHGSTFPDKGSASAGPNFRTGLYFGDPGKLGPSVMVLYTDEMKAGRASQGVGFEDVAPSEVVGATQRNRATRYARQKCVKLHQCASHVRLSIAGNHWVRICALNGANALETTAKHSSEYNLSRLLPVSGLYVLETETALGSASYRIVIW